MTAFDPTLRSQAAAWAAQDPDAATSAALGALIDKADAGDDAAITEIASAFAGPLEFGTAGLRAALGPGPSRMNRVVVARAAKGLSAWLLEQGHAGGRIIIGYDARYNSDVFARDSAEILAADGFEVLLTDRPTPTPVVAFGIRHYGCVAGIVVTASHNPPGDNGYKVYLGDGSQIIPPVDSQIAGHIDAVSQVPFADIPKSDGFTTLDDELVDAYVARAASLVDDDAPRDIAWVYTAMHGVGSRVVQRVVAAAGFPEGLPVAEQDQPDPAFPTVPFPNPEEPGAIDLAIDLASRTAVDVVIANDPDADRCAVAAPFPLPDGSQTWRMLTGDELGALIGADFLSRRVAGNYANSVVSSTLLRRMALAAGTTHVTTLTGFKWIGRVPGLAFGYEEAIGYCCDSEAVADKDGITALLTVLRIAASLKEQGSSIAARLDEIACRYGVHATSQLSVRVTDRQIIADAMARLRANPPRQLLGESVDVRDLAAGADDLPPTDAVELTGQRVHVVVRPSGTEPKLKCYLEARIDANRTRADVGAARQEAAAMLVELRDHMTAVLGI